MSNGQRTLKVLQLIGGYVVVKKAVKVANFLNSPPKQKTVSTPKAPARALTPEERADIKASFRAGVDFLKAITDDGPTDVTLKFDGNRLVTVSNEQGFDMTNTGTRQVLEQDGVDDTGEITPLDEKPKVIEDLLSDFHPEKSEAFETALDKITRGDAT